jgi:hypothetical protein
MELTVTSGGRRQKLAVTTGIGKNEVGRFRFSQSRKLSEREKSLAIFPTSKVSQRWMHYYK